MITGVSRGLGAALFDGFCDAGDRVLALGRRFTESQRAEQRSDPDRIRLRVTDLASCASLPSVDELAAFVTGGPPEVVLVHNAAVFDPFGPIGALGAAGIAAAVAVNLTAPMVLTDALLACPLAAGRRLTVGYISSAAAHRVDGGRAMYGSTKRGGEMFFETLAAEHHDDPAVRVAVIDPGIMDTDMQAVVRRHAREDEYFPGRERFIERYERGELPSPVDVARRVLAEHFA